MNFKDYKRIVKSDIYRVLGRIPNVLGLMKIILFGSSIKYIFWMRTTRYLYESCLFRYSLYYVSKYFLIRQRYKFGIQVSHMTNIGFGFYIGHFGGIVINENCTIGNNCNISQGVTIGQSNRGDNAGVPTIGNNVYIGPGAKIFGSVIIGDNVAIGANCVVTKSVKSNAVVVGIPGKVISDDGSFAYINRTNYQI